MLRVSFTSPLALTNVTIYKCTLASSLVVAAYVFTYCPLLNSHSYTISILLLLLQNFEIYRVHKYLKQSCMFVC